MDYNNHHTPSRKKTGVRGGVPVNWAVQFPRPLEKERRVTREEHGTEEEWVESYRAALQHAGRPQGDRVGQRSEDPLRARFPEFADIRDEIVDEERPASDRLLWEDII